MTNLKILVAGGCGYIGTHMVKALLATGHDVVTLDNLSNGNRALLPCGEFVLGDIGDAGTLDRLFTARRITGHPIPAVEGARRPGDPAGPGGLIGQGAPDTWLAAQVRVPGGYH